MGWSGVLEGCLEREGVDDGARRGVREGYGRC